MSNVCQTSEYFHSKATRETVDILLKKKGFWSIWKQEQKWIEQAFSMELSRELQFKYKSSGLQAKANV